jgi:hypothetical protein
VLRKAGEPAKAADVLYAGRERARQMASGLRYIGLTLLKWTIGYGLGLRYFRCLWWLAGLTLIGLGVLQAHALACWLSESICQAIWPCYGHIDIADSIVYSFQKPLPPFAKLKEFSGIILGPVATWYFYLHQLIGYVLAGFRLGRLDAEVVGSVSFITVSAVWRLRTLVHSRVP